MSPRAADAPPKPALCPPALRSGPGCSGRELKDGRGLEGQPCRQARRGAGAGPRAGGGGTGIRTQLRSPTPGPQPLGRWGRNPLPPTPGCPVACWAHLLPHCGPSASEIRPRGAPPAAGAPHPPQGRGSRCSGPAPCPGPAPCSGPAPRQRLNPQPPRLAGCRGNDLSPPGLQRGTPSPWGPHGARDLLTRDRDPRAGAGVPG